MNQEEKVVPQFLKNRVDLRYLTVDMFDLMLSTIREEKIKGVTNPESVRTVIITNFGTITADIVNIGDEDTKTGVIFHITKVLVDKRNEQLSKHEEENQDIQLRPINDSSFIFLRNAVILPFANPNQPFNVGEMLLFTDQIVGLSGISQEE